MESTHLHLDHPQQAHWRAWLARPLVALCAFAALQVAAAEPMRVRVINVLDGDTVMLAGHEHRVRLSSIDAPEGDHGPHKPGQPFHAVARGWLAMQVLGREVTMRCFDQDRYGRLVCEFWRNEKSINVEMVRAGLAWANTSNPRYVRNPAVLAAQEEARKARRGLWQQPAVAPWEWRRQCWEEKRCAH